MCISIVNLSKIPETNLLINLTNIEHCIYFTTGYTGCTLFIKLWCDNVQQQYLASRPVVYTLTGICLHPAAGIKMTVLSIMNTVLLNFQVVICECSFLSFQIDRLVCRCVNFSQGTQ